MKAMLLRGMKNRDIQFYFNRQDRPVNSGRITQIRDGSYGPEVIPASSRDLDAFLSGFVPAKVGAVLSVPQPSELSLAEKAKMLFEQRGRAGWFLRSHETDKTECKEKFCIRPDHRFADPVRSIAGLANNGGGFVFFGVAEREDGSLQVVGLPDNTFASTDPAEINRFLSGVLDPVPRFETCVIEFDGRLVGAIHIEKHEHPPVIATKNIGSEVKEGAIYFRYVGETRVIKPGELRQIIAYREQKAVAEFARNMQRVASGAVATIDLDSGKVAGKNAAFVIDEELLPKLQFIREGDFNQSNGAPALRLIGDVAATAPPQTRREIITDEAVLLNFLRGHPVAEPLQYIRHCAHTGKAWLPLFYYANASRKSLEEIIATLNAEDAVQPKRRDAAVKRLYGGKAAFQKAMGKAKVALSKTLTGTLALPTSHEEA